MNDRLVTFVRNLVSLSRTESRLAQEYREMGNESEHDRLRRNSVAHMRDAYSWRDKFYSHLEESHERAA